MKIDIQIREVTPNEAKKLFENLWLTISEKDIKNLKSTSWSDEEKNAIRNAPDANTAFHYYREAFPNGMRTRGSILRKWRKLNKQPGIPVTDASSENNEKPTESTRGGNAWRRIWTPQELSCIVQAKNKEEAWKLYIKEFPNSERNQNGIRQKYNLINNEIKKKYNPDTKIENPGTLSSHPFAIGSPVSIKKGIHKGLTGNIIRFIGRGMVRIKLSTGTETACVIADEIEPLSKKRY